MSLTAQSPQPSLAWQFESSNVDSVTGLAPTTSVGPPTYNPSGKYGSSIVFANTPGTSPGTYYIKYTTGISLSTASGFTICAWVKPLAVGVSGNQTCISISNGTTFFIFQIDTGQTNIHFYGQNPYTVPNVINGSGQNVTQSQWIHVAVSFSGSAITTYYNGVVKDNLSLVVYPLTFNALGLGNRSAISADSSANCEMDDLRIYNTALSSSQIQSIYQAQGMPSRGVAIPQYIKSATGGDTVQVINGYRIHTFTTVGTATFTPATSGLIDVLVVAGGGGSGGNNGGGGSGGQVQYLERVSVSGATTVTVGAGGTAGSGGTNTTGGTGGSSIFGSTTSVGGGGGGRGFGGVNGNSSGYGGGRGFGVSVTGQVSGTPGSIAYSGGGSYDTTGATYGTASSGGGGGAGGAGGDGTLGKGGNGGKGVYYSISGTSSGYGGGGAGNGYGGTAGTASEGGGGVGGPYSPYNEGTPGTPNTGGGAGGGWQGGNRDGSIGGSGIVIVRYPVSAPMTGTPLFTQLSSAATSSAVGAFSLRAVNGTTAKAVQVRRSSDSATQDFYADRLGNLLTAPVTGQSLANWLGGATGYVTTWYDQSGKGNHATQATAANQPVIQQATKGPGYSTVFTGSQWVSYGTTSTFANTPFSVCAVVRRSNGNNRNAWGGWGDTNPNVAWNAQFLTPGDTIQISNRTVGASSTVPVWTSSEGVYYITHTLSNNFYANNYVNGAYSAQGNWTTFLSAATTNNAQIGRTSGQGTPNTFYGEIFELLAFNKSLYDLDNTNGLVTQIYNNQFSYTGT